MAAPTVGGLADIRRALLDMKVRQSQVAKAERERIVPVPRGGKLAVSEQQRYLWFLHQLSPDSPTYNEPYAMRLRGELDVGALTEALRGLVSRHEGLRTRFGNEHGVPYQVIDPAPQVWPLPVREGDERSIQDWIDAEAAVPFDLHAGPVCRSSLLRVSADDHVLVLTLHHVVTDGWSARRICEELATRYAAAHAGTTASFAELVVAPADHAAWQRLWLLGDEPSAQVDYWRDALLGLQPLDFPADRPRPVRPSAAGAIHESALPDELCRALREQARSQGVSLLALLLAGFQVVMGRYTGQQDLAFGSLLSGRTRSEVEPMVGFFANTVVVRGNLAGNPTFRELAGRCNESVLNATANQDVPFGTLVEALKPERLPGRNPLFQHIFTFLPATMVPEFQFAGLQVETRMPQPGSSRFDFSVQVTDEPGGGLGVWIEYSTELYERGRIERLVEHLTTVLSSAMATPDTPVDSLDMLSDAEVHQVLTGWNPAPGPRDGRLLHEVFAQRAAEKPDRVAMRFDGADLSYGELDVRANRLAHLLVEDFGVAPGRVVGVLLDRGFDLAVAELGVLKAGGAWLPLDPQYPVQRLGYQLRDADVAAVVTTSDLVDRLPAGVRHIALDSGGLAGRPDTAPVVAVDAEDIAYVIYTSGSTGAPKGVMVPHRAVVNFCATFGEMFAVTPADRILQFSNPAFDVSVSDFFATFAAGATLVGAPRTVLLDPDALQRLIVAERVSIMDIPPPVLGLLDPLPCTDLRLLFIGMEPFGAQLVNRWSQPGREFHNGYGPTEVTISCVDYLCPLQPLDGPPPIGRAMANQRAYVLDKQGRPAPIGVSGELYMAGAGVARGYLGQPARTAEKFVPDPFAPTPGERMYATGDLVRWRADGNLEFLGRIDRQVKLRGLRIELGEIEHALASHPAVRQTTVVVKDAGTPQARLIGYLVPERDQEVDPDQVRAYVADRLPLHMVPTTLLVLDELPLTPTGKLDPSRLPDGEPLAGAGPAALSTPTQLRLADIWHALLNLDAGQIGAQDSFFTLGGNSLQVTQLISRIRDAFQVTLDPRQLFTHPVLQQLAEQIDTAGTPPPDEAELARLEESIAELSEAELDRLLGGQS